MGDQVKRVKYQITSPVGCDRIIPYGREREEKSINSSNGLKS